MIIHAARLSIANLFAAETRKVFWRVLGVTLLILIALWFALRGIFLTWILPWLQGFLPPVPDWTSWLGFLLAVLAGLVLALLISPVTALIAGLFLDEVADVVERRDYAADPPGRAMAFTPALLGSIKFLGVVVAGNVLALLLLFIPGINLMAFFLVNGYLLGREFFEFAAMRFRPVEEARRFRSRHGLTVFLAGLVIAAYLAIPIVNLTTPLFAAAMMVHLHKMLSLEDADRR